MIDISRVIVKFTFEGVESCISLDDIIVAEAERSDSISVLVNWEEEGVSDVTFQYNKNKSFFKRDLTKPLDCKVEHRSSDGTLCIYCIDTEGLGDEG